MSAYLVWRQARSIILIRRQAKIKSSLRVKSLEITNFPALLSISLKGEKIAFSYNGNLITIYASNTRPDNQLIATHHIIINPRRFCQPTFRMLILCFACYQQDSKSAPYNKPHRHTPFSQTWNCIRALPNPFIKIRSNYFRQFIEHDRYLQWKFHLLNLHFLSCRVDAT